MEESYYDPYYWVNGRTQGWGLSAGKHKLNAENALIFARSRKGDSDYGRAARQQQLIMAAVQKVRAKGLEVLPKLLQIAARTVRTDLPRDKAAEIFDIVSRANLGKAKQAVFGPRAFGVILGPSRYELDPKKTEKWIAKNFPPITMGATWPPSATSAPAPSGSVTP
jgi:predicted HAD superfamily Cof-like phosphohydrolase